MHNSQSNFFNVEIDSRDTALLLILPRLKLICRSMYANRFVYANVSRTTCIRNVCIAHYIGGHVRIVPTDRSSFCNVGMPLTIQRIQTVCRVQTCASHTRSICSCAIADCINNRDRINPAKVSGSKLIRSKCLSMIKFLDFVYISYY